jgi:hypothetical protein
MTWAFVDYENVGSLEGLTASVYERVFVFCGPKNTRIKVDALPTEGFCPIEVIRVSTTGRNNLDFHLAFHIGRFHEVADQDVAFHIVSNDSGFDGLVSHLNKLGRRCKKVTPKAAAPKQKKTAVLSDAASLVVKRLRQLEGRKRPRKKASFINWIKSQCQGLATGAHPESVCKELVHAKFIRESGSNIAYQLAC